MAKKHSLGFGNGRIIEYEDGTAAYVESGKFTQAFRVKIADVSGFSVAKGKKMLERTFNVHGNGTLLASTSVNHGVSEKIEKWLRAHPRSDRALEPRLQQWPKLLLDWSPTSCASWRSLRTRASSATRSSRPRRLGCSAPEVDEPLGTGLD